MSYEFWFLIFGCGECLFEIMGFHPLFLICFDTCGFNVIKSQRILSSIKDITILFWDPKFVKDRFESVAIRDF